jgi:hypothetical protein
MNVSMKKDNTIFNCNVVPTVLEGDLAFEIPNRLFDQLSLKEGDTVSFKQQIGDRYSMIIHRSNKSND